MATWNSNCRSKEKRLVEDSSGIKSDKLYLGTLLYYAKRFFPYSYQLLKKSLMGTFWPKSKGLSKLLGTL